MQKELSVISCEGIGPLKLGMSPEEILDALQRLRSDWTSLHEIQISGDDSELRYQDGASFFMVGYDDGRAVEIAVDNQIREQIIVDFCGIDVFKTTAESLVACLKERSRCICDAEDELWGTNFEFTDLGLRLWREDVYHPSFLDDPAYAESMGETLPEMQQYEYFQIIAVHK